jgi:hypothetical protein
MTCGGLHERAVLLCGNTGNCPVRGQPHIGEIYRVGSDLFGADNEPPTTKQKVARPRRSHQGANQIGEQAKRR